MLSKEQQEALSTSLQEWATTEGISHDVASMVAEIALSNPASNADVTKFCDEHMWSQKLAEVYSKFLVYLRDSKEPKTTVKKGLREKLMKLAEDLYTIAESIDA